MRLGFFWIAVLALSSLALAQGPADVLVPAPRRLTSREGRLRLPAAPRIRLLAPAAADRAALARHAEVFADEIELLSGQRARPLATITAPAVFGPDLCLVIEGGRGEAYRLTIDGDGVVLRAATSAGIAAGTATLLQLFEFSDDGASTLPFLRIEDAPRSAYRSVMIDVARQPHSIGVLRDVIRLARLYKIRYVHLHLTDDQHFTFPFAPVTDRLQNNHVYSRNELVDLVAYAEDRGVTLIPEIDLPGHSSRLRSSGYLDGARSDRDVAAARHFPALARLFDEVMDVFAPSPFFHVGGDESGAGDALVPFLARVQKHVRSRGRRLMVWEGFHGAPVEALPAYGPDRVLVAAWESSYNPPWKLLEAGYEIINASWAPLYIVGADSLLHPGVSAGRRWSPGRIARWNPQRFEHWEPGRAVFEDRGPFDPNLFDHAWPVPAFWRDRVRGAQISVWEQRESSVIRTLRQRLPVLAERLWSGPQREGDPLLARVSRADARVFGLVQPVEVLPEGRTGTEVDLVFRTPPSPEAVVRFRSRVRVPGRAIFSTREFRARPDWIDAPRVPDPAADAAARARTTDAPGAIGAGRVVRARWQRADGRVLEGTTWARFLSLPPRVRVRELTHEGPVPDRIPDLAARPASHTAQVFEMPFLRGPLDHSRPRAWCIESRLEVETTAEYEITIKTQSGRASLYLDRDADGTWDPEDRLVADTPTNEAPQKVRLRLEAGRSYPLRVDHISALPRPALIVGLRGPKQPRPRDITPWLKPPAAR